MKATPDLLTGKTDSHIEHFEGTTPLHRDVIPPFLLLRERAKAAGFRLQIVSAFRSFEAQLRIWNLKATGKRDLLDANGDKLDFDSLSDEEVVFAILRWSALPGASRHHWGTEMDVVDGHALDMGYQVQLVPAEGLEGGPFGKLNAWLTENLSGEGFFRPYVKDLGGVSPEWWHLSFAPVAQDYFQTQTSELIKTVIQGAPMEKKEIVLSHLPFIYERYVRNILLP